MVWGNGGRERGGGEVGSAIPINIRHRTNRRGAPRRKTVV